MVKSFARYELAGTHGVITSNCNIVHDASGKHIITAALENIAVWNVRQETLVKLLQGQQSATGRAAAEVTQLAISTSGNQLAAGHANGTVRVWNLDSGECEVTLEGHKAAVTALRYNNSGAMLASGSQDTDVIVWDAAAESGLFRLRGHTGQVTDLVFVAKGNWLISCSKDSHVRVWDLATQHCCQTLIAHRAEVWSLDVDPAEERLAVGTADAQLNVYRIRDDASAGVAPAAVANALAAAGTGAGDEPLQGQQQQAAVLEQFGAVRRQSGDRVQQVRYVAKGRLLACQAAGKLLEVFEVRSEAEAAKRLKRRKKRKREKAREVGEGEDGIDDLEPTAADELAPFQIVRTKQKMRSMAWHPPAGGAAGSKLLAQVTVALVNNSMEVWDVSEAAATRGLVIESAGHRSDIRAAVMSPDDSILLTASSNQVKLWNPATGTVLRTAESGYGLCALFSPGARHAIVGTKEGTLDVLDVGSGERVASEPAHKGRPIWAVAALPDGSGFVSGSADHDVKFWEWDLEKTGEGGLPSFGIAHTRTATMTDDVLCVRISPNGKLLAVALLDSTIKVFFTDSLKFFLSLYGHKLPVLSMDISHDSRLLVSGSADKNVKVWGLDFGDCHRSLFAHADSVMQVAFVPRTHLVFTAGKDKLVKQWDADGFVGVQALEGHQSEVWALAVSSMGDFVVTAGHDRSWRRWERSEEPLFLEEEREKRLESLFEADLEDTTFRNARDDDATTPEGTVAPAGRRTLESLGAADAVADALQMAAHDARRREEAREAEASGRVPDKGALEGNPLMLGLDPGAYVLEAVEGVKAANLEQALLVLPFGDALRLLGYLSLWLERGSRVELACRIAALLLRLHQPQLAATPSARPVLTRLQGQLRDAVQVLKDTLGFNLASVEHIKRVVADRGTLGSEPRVMKSTVAGS